MSNNPQILHPETGEVVEQEQSVKTFDEVGNEINDPTPLSIPVGYQRPETLMETLERFAQLAVRRAQAGEVPDDVETIEEAEDFDVDDDFDHFENQLEALAKGKLSIAIDEEPIRMAPAISPTPAAEPVAPESQTGEGAEQ